MEKRHDKQVKQLKKITAFIAIYTLIPSNELSETRIISRENPER
jgi:hypothetical protein